jgi:hypothetical protein
MVRESSFCQYVFLAAVGSIATKTRCLQLPLPLSFLAQAQEVQLFLLQFWRPLSLRLMGMVFYSLRLECLSVGEVTCNRAA